MPVSSAYCDAGLLVLLFPSSHRIAGLFLELVSIKVACILYFLHVNLIGQPGSYIDLRGIVVGHVHQQEEITQIHESQRQTFENVFLIYKTARTPLPGLTGDCTKVVIIPETAKFFSVNLLATAIIDDVEGRDDAELYILMVFVIVKNLLG